MRQDHRHEVTEWMFMLVTLIGAVALVGGLVYGAIDTMSKGLSEAITRIAVPSR